MTVRPFTDHDIHLSLDGELPAEEREEFEAWLERNPDKKALRDRYVEDRERLRRALAGVVDEELPERLARFGIDGPSPTRAWSWGRVAAGIALFAAGGALGYLAGAYAPPPGGNGAAQVAERAIEAHVIYSAEKLHVVEVGADQKDHLVGWLSKRVGTTLVAPDFSASGYELVGGRLLPADSRAAAMFIYQDATGARISLYVVRDPGAPDTGFKLREELGACALYWLDGGYGYAVTATNMSGETLRALAGTAYQQLLAAQRG
ncbi:MAG TPA: anti-sigma factor [Rhizobiales bacterium]|nr:anti-sigma factor [Hyphomicrobiales bacterium]